MIPLRFSALKQFAKSPAHYAAYLKQEQATTSAMDVGSAADLMILGGKRVVAYPGAVRRGKEFDAFTAGNFDAMIVTKKEYEQANGIAEAVLNSPDAVEALTGTKQQTVTWEMNGRTCRGTPDVIRPYYGLRGSITDLKTGETSDPRRFPWKMRSFSYHAAMAWYLDGLTLAGLDVTDAYIVAVEQSPPHVVTVFRLTEHVLDIGRRLYRTWFEQLQVCEASGEFPAYSQSIVELDLPDEDEIEISDAVQFMKPVPRLAEARDLKATEEHEEVARMATMGDTTSSRTAGAAMGSPKRIQRKRTKGWRMPEGAVYVGRPTKWGNPYTVGMFGDRESVIAYFRKFAACDNQGGRDLREAIEELRGKDLACWCPLVDKHGNRVPCHADVLLELANAVDAVRLSVEPPIVAIRE